MNFQIESITPRNRLNVGKYKDFFEANQFQSSN